MKAIFMGTPDFAVPTLRALSEKGHKVELVITQQDKKKGRGKKVAYTPVKESAIELGIEVYQPEDVNSEESIDKIKSINADVIVVVAYGQILCETILKHPQYGCLNVHASILPKYRGAAPINWAVIDGELESGVTIMEMERGLDTGDIISLVKVAITESMTAGELHDRLMEVGAEALTEALESIERGDFSKTPQEDEKSTYAPMMNKKLGHIDWNKPSKEVSNLIRGTQPWPGSYFYYGDTMIKVRESEVTEGLKSDDTGVIVDANDTGIYICTVDGVLKFSHIQAPGKRWMSVKEYLRGNKIDKGSRVL